MAPHFTSRAATILLLLLTWIVRHTVALNNVTLIFHRQIPTPAPLVGQPPPDNSVPSSEEDVTSLLKFHVSGLLGTGFVEMARSFKGSPQLNNLSTMLDAKLTKLFRKKMIHDVQIDSVRRNGAEHTFTATMYFDREAHVRNALITKLLEEDQDLKIRVIYIYEYCSDSTCNGHNGECDFNGGQALCTCMTGYTGDRCRTKTYPDKDYFMAGTICGVIFAIIVALLVVFCRTYRFHTHADSTATSEASSVGTSHSSNDRYSSCQEVYVKKPYESGFLTYKNIATTKPGGAGIVNQAFVVDSALQRKLSEDDRKSSSEGDTIYKKQLRKFFEDAPQMRLNETVMSGDNSFTETEAKTMRGSAGSGKTMNSYAPPPQTPRPMVLNSSSRKKHKHIS